MTSRCAGSCSASWSAPAELDNLAEMTRMEATAGFLAPTPANLALVSSVRTRWFTRHVDIEDAPLLHLRKGTLIPAREVIIRRITSGTGTDGDSRLYSREDDFAMVQDPRPGERPEEFQAAYVRTRGRSPGRGSSRRLAVPRPPRGKRCAAPALAGRRACRLRTHRGYEEIFPSHLLQQPCVS